MQPHADPLRRELESAHHDVGELVAVLEHWEETRAQASVDAVMEFLRVRVREHFLWEERVLFPRILASNPELRDTIVHLREQHLDLLRDIAALYQDLSGGLVAPGRRPLDLAAYVRPIVDRLIAHARLEDEALLPRLQA